MRVADFIIARLISAGVRHIFGTPGGFIAPLLDAILDRSEIEFVAFHSEQAASLAAVAAAKLDGISCCLVTGGPGVTNAITGLASAWTNGAAVIFISGQCKVSDLMSPRQRQNGPQEVPTIGMTHQFCKCSDSIFNAEYISGKIDKLIYYATTGRKGPVWLSVCLDAQTKIMANEDCGWTGFNPRGMRHDDANELVVALRDAKRPLILFGGGVRDSGAAGLARQFIDKTMIPFQTTWAGTDLFADDHMAYAGRPGMFGTRWANLALQNCDVLLTIGVRWDLITTAFNRENFGCKAKRFAVDMDLAELEKLPNDVTKIHADAKAFLEAIVASMPERFAFYDSDDWTTRIRQWKARYPLVIPQGNKLSTYAFVDVLSDCLQEGDIIVSGSAGNHSEQFFQAFRVKAGQRIIADHGLGAMGFGIPAAIGAAKASGKRVVLVEGDGSLMPNLQELETIGSLPISIFVINNGGYASIRQSQQAWFGRAMPTFESGIDNMDEFCRCLGLDYYWCHKSRMKQDILDVLASKRPILCEVHVDPDETRSPRVASHRNESGEMVTDAIEDMTPKLPADELADNMR